MTSAMSLCSKYAAPACENRLLYISVNIVQFLKVFNMQMLYRVFIFHFSGSGAQQRQSREDEKGDKSKNCLTINTVSLISMNG